MGFRGLCRGLTGLGVLGILGAFAYPASAGTVEPAFTLATYANCTPGSRPDHLVYGHYTGFPPSQQHVLTFHDNEQNLTYVRTFVSDANGEGYTGGYSGTGQTDPWSGIVLFHRDDNANGRVDNGEPLIFAANVTVDQACQDGTVAPK